jgi:hypothetical protein
MPDGERVDLPSGDSLWYFDEDHSYWRHNPQTEKRGRRLTGVTTIVKPLDYNPENLLRWAARTQCEGIALLYKESEGEEFLRWLTDANAIWRELEAHGLTYENIKDRKGEEGTNVHQDAFQALAMGRAVPNLDALRYRERGLARAVSAFWLDHEPKADLVEQIVYSRRLGVAGRLDFRGLLTARCDNPLCACQEADGPGVVDLKTGNFISAAAHAQVGGGYPLLAEESGFGGGDWAAILQVREDGSYDLFKAEGTPQYFESAVDTYRSAGKINYAAGKAREARKVQRTTEAEIAEAVASV